MATRAQRLMVSGQNMTRGSISYDGLERLPIDNVTLPKPWAMVWPRSVGIKTYRDGSGGLPVMFDATGRIAARQVPGGIAIMLR